MGSKRIAWLALAGALVSAIDGRALLIDNFEDGGFSLVGGCAPPANEELSSVENWLSGTLAGRRNSSIIPLGPLPNASCGSLPAMTTFATALLSPGIGNGGALIVITNGSSVIGSGPIFGLSYSSPALAPWDMTDNGASDMLLIELPEVGGPFELTVTGMGTSFGMRVLAVDAAGTLNVPLAIYSTSVPRGSAPMFRGSTPSICRSSQTWGRSSNASSSRNSAASRSRSLRSCSWVV